MGIEGERETHVTEVTQVTEVHRNIFVGLNTPVSYVDSRDVGCETSIYLGDPNGRD